MNQETHISAKLAKIGHKRVDREKTYFTVQNLAHARLRFTPDPSKFFLAIAALANKSKNLNVKVRLDCQEARFFLREAEILEEGLGRTDMRLTVISL